MPEIPIIDLLGNGIVPDAYQRDYDGTWMDILLFFMDIGLKKKKSLAVPQCSNILLIGGSVKDVAILYKQFPKAMITVVNLDGPYLAQIQRQYENKPGHLLRLFRAVQRSFLLIKHKAGNPIFPDGIFDLIAAPGVDESCFPKNGPAILQRIAQEEVGLVKKGGLILHDLHVKCCGINGVS